jgi:hypothetical protein
MERLCGCTTHGGVVADRESQGPGSGSEGGWGWADEEHLLMQALVATDPQSPCHGATTEPHVVQLRERDHVVLLAGDPADLPLPSIHFLGPVPLSEMGPSEWLDTNHRRSLAAENGMIPRKWMAQRRIETHLHPKQPPRPILHPNRCTLLSVPAHPG